MTGDERLLLDSALTAASTLLGATLTCVGGPFPGGDRAVVVRASRSDTGQSVIVKAYNPHRAGEGWAREAAALTALAGMGTRAPEVLAVVAVPPVVVMEDLGPRDSVATALLGTDPETATRAVVEWAEVLAELHAATWNNSSRFAAALIELGELAGSAPVDPDALPSVLTDGVERLRRAAATVGVEVSEQVRSEILQLAALLGDDIHVVSPSDPCPDNNVRTASGLRLFDFEGATVAHPAWDVAYLCVPWPSCWCAWRLPDSTAERAQQAWRERLAVGLAARGRDFDRPAMDAAVRLTTLVWCLITVGWFLPGAQLDRRAGGAGLNAPRLRAVVQHRLGLLAASDATELAASRDLARQLSAALTTHWPPESLPLAPAFQPSQT